MRNRAWFFMGVARMWVLVWLGLSGGAGTGWADGKVFAPVMVPQQVEMPDQRALLAWKDGVETLVIESAFVGKGTDFAWVVPLPDKPEVFAATRGTLPAAVAMMQPEVVNGAGFLGGLGIVAGVVGLVALGFGWRGVDVVFRAAVLGLLGAVLGGVGGAAFGVQELTGVIGAGVAIWLGRGFVRRPSRLAEVLLTLLVGLVLAAMMMPAFGKVREMADDGAGVEGGVKVERSVVGDFDVAVIAGSEGAGVAGWLETNGFALDAEARAVVVEHAAAGGWFVASRVRREFAESGRSVPAPLAFRFKAERPVYPMRLTGAGATRELAVELVVFGPSRAEAAGFETRAVAPVEFGEIGEQVGWRGKGPGMTGRKVSHPELVRWAHGATVATWLRGTLSPAQMEADVRVAWGEDARPVGLSAMAEPDAWVRALALGGLVVFAGALVCGLAFPPGRPPTTWAVVVMALALGATGTLRALTPTVAVTRADGGMPWYRLREISQVAGMTLWDLPVGAGDAEVRAAFARELEKYAKPYEWRVRVGDAPGEVELQKRPDGKWRVLFYDAYGQAGVMKGDEWEVGEGKSSGP